MLNCKRLVNCKKDILFVLNYAFCIEKNVFSVQKLSI